MTALERRRAPEIKPCRRRLLSDNTPGMEFNPVRRCLLCVEHHGIPRDAVGPAGMISTGNMSGEDAAHQQGCSGFGTFADSLHDLLNKEMSVPEREIEIIRNR